MDKEKNLTINISSLTLLKVLLVILAVFFLFYIREVVLILFVAIILGSAFAPWVNWLGKYKIPRSVSILFIYLVMILALAGITYLIIPPIVVEVNQISKDFPFYWEEIIQGVENFQNYSDSRGWNANIEQSLDSLRSNLGTAATGIFNTVSSFFGGIISFFLILVITFYLTVEDQAVKRMSRAFIPAKFQPYLNHLFNRMQEKIGYWLRGQLLLSLIIFLFCWIGLMVLGVKYALVLALFAGITELIPYLGPFIGAVPAVLIGFTQSPMIAVGVIILYTIIQFLENNIIVPKLMQKVVGLNPVVTIVAIMVGFKLAGVLGIILAVPVTTALGVAIEDLINFSRKKEVKEN